MKPFSTPVLAKRTYRELKLLKHIQHENVRLHSTRFKPISSRHVQIISLSDVFISPLEDMCVPFHVFTATGLPCVAYSYFVTELLGTDLHRLLTSRPLEKQFIQYFLYQILVCHSFASFSKAVLTLTIARFEVCALGWRCSS